MIWNDDTEQSVGVIRDEKYGKVTLTYVDIVRCKDCKYHGNICPDYCVNLEQNTNDDFYCAYGVNKHE